MVLANKSREREREREREHRDRKSRERRKRENLKMSDTHTHTDRRDRDTRERVKKKFLGPLFGRKMPHHNSKKPTPQTECDLLGKFFSHTYDALLIKESI